MYSAPGEQYPSSIIPFAIVNRRHRMYISSVLLVLLLVASPAECLSPTRSKSEKTKIFTNNDKVAGYDICGTNPYSVKNPHPSAAPESIKIPCEVAMNEVILSLTGSKSTKIEVKSGSEKNCLRVITCDLPSDITGRDVDFFTDELCDRNGDYFIWNTDTNQKIDKSGQSTPYSKAMEHGDKPYAAFTTDPECKLYVSSGSFSIMKRYLNPTKSSKQEDLDIVETPAFRLKFQERYYPERVGPYLVPREHTYLKPQENKLESKPCNSVCDYGSVIVFDIPRAASFATNIYVMNSCSWMRICLKSSADKPAYCESEEELGFYFKNSFLLLAENKHGIPMRFKRGDENKDFFAVNLDYSSHNEAGSNVHQVVITSWNKEQAYHRLEASHTGLTFMFSSPECLKKSYGITNLPANGNVFSLNPAENEPVKGNVSGTAPDVSVTAKPGEELLSTEPTTTPEPPSTRDPTLTLPPTPPPPQAPGGEVNAQHRNPNELGGVDEITNLGWATWGIFFGFLAGSCASFAIAGLVMYLCRRSFYSDWYRGMYKRYGCDASGTTGGITGADFGNTTGAQTVGGDSQMGSTVATTTENTTNTSNTTDMVTM